MSIAPAETHAASLDKASASALEVLDRFSQRNRNQHRVAKWWSQVGILRRALRRLLETLRAQENHLISSRKNLGARQKLSAKSSAAADQRRESVVARATWLCTHVLPQAYISFTQVAADKQHAALGLFLVGLVAFLQQSLRPLVPEPQPLGKTVSKPAAPGLSVDDGDDMGVAISRTMFDAKMPSPGPVRDAPMATTKKTKTKQSITPAVVATVASGSGNSGAPPRRKRSPEVKSNESKVKRKKKKGDDFANLFGSLL
ncbi:hypothetical protein F5X68DRAFT_264852 [Plectosphaerella plurivora]|uniref:RNase MRP protein 1 RNA binding domain-containing protein n=1 Tax=Plectosphaerella plurivora TaxID=936078 RepID=A0A9P8V3Z6_9PEZI|nr:hypothetical protein F5X68DRAFT_264852 [Plectosphaerella plurivora]